MMFNFIIFVISFVFSTQLCLSAEIAFSFDDSPMSDSNFFKSSERTDKLIEIMKKYDIKGAMIFSNPCNGEKNSVLQLRKYLQAGHFIANHTCSHLNFDSVGFDKFIFDAEKADKLLSELLGIQKYFRFPFLHEGIDLKNRDKMRNWLKAHNYRNGFVSVDNDDYVFSQLLNQAKIKNKKINLNDLEKIYVNHLIGAVEFYDRLAKEKIGYSPKHVILLHENDSSVLFFESFVKELQKRKWKFISVDEAYKDKIYFELPKNTYSNDGIIAQIAFEKTGIKIKYDKYKETLSALKMLLDLK